MRVSWNYSCTGTSCSNYIGIISNLQSCFTANLEILVTWIPGGLWFLTDSCELFPTRDNLPTAPQWKLSTNQWVPRKSVYSQPVQVHFIAGKKNLCDNDVVTMNTMDLNVFCCRKKLFSFSINWPHFRLDWTKTNFL